MIPFIRQLFTPVYEDTALTILRRRFIQVLDGAGLIVLAIVLTLSFLQGTGADGFGLLWVMTGIGLLVLALLRFRFIDLASIILIATLTFAALQYGDSLLLPGLLALMSATALSGREIYYLTTALVVGKQLTIVLNIAATSSENVFDFSGEFGVLLGLLIVSVASRYFVVVMEQAVRESQRRTRLLEATAEIGQVATAMLDLNELFSRSVEMIKDRFGFYHVQVFMVNGDQAELVASTGEVGQRLLANKHKLPVGSNSVIGYVTRYGEAVIARSTDAVHRFNPLLPDTRTELAVPIFEGDKIIGALDMQSVEPDAFRPEDVQALRSMANALAAAIRNAQLFEAQEHSIREQQRLYLESQDNLREIQRLNRQLTRAGWDDYLRQSRHAAGVTLQNERIVTETEWTDSLIEAARQRQVVTRPANGRPGVVAVPVVLRGEVIGAIEVEPTESTSQRDAVETVQAIAQRLATSLENARLFEEAQAATVQEQRINQIVTRYQSATTVDDLLRITLTELSEALGAQRGAIRLGMIPDDGGSSA